MRRTGVMKSNPNLVLDKKGKINIFYMLKIDWPEFSDFYIFEPWAR